MVPFGCSWATAVSLKPTAPAPSGDPGMPQGERGGAEAPRPRTGSISPDPGRCWVPGEVSGTAQISEQAWLGSVSGSTVAPGRTCESLDG